MSGSGRPLTGGSNRPYTANSEYRPQTAWSESEPPSTAHGPASYAYPTQQYAPGQHQHHLYAQEEMDEEEEEESEEEDVFAYLPPGTAQSDVQPHQVQPTLTQPKQQQQPISAAQLHNLVAAAGLDPGPTPPYSQAPQPPQPQPQPLGQQPLTRSTASGPPETGSSYDNQDFGPDSYSMRPIPFSPAGPAMYPAANAANKTLTRTSDSREVRVELPSTGGSFSSSYAPASPGMKRRISSEPDTSIVDMTTTLKYTDEAGGVEDDEEDSPYAEVRASVSNTDDMEMPAATIRMWFLGLLICLVAISVNTFFNFRYPSPYVTSLLVLLISYPCGKFLAYALPIRTFYLPSWLGGGSFSLNPGPFNVKEHVLIYMMSNVSASPSYAMNTIVVSQLFYALDFGLGFEFTLVLATQMTGLGFAGLAREYLVWPASMIWPYNLVSCTLLNTLHAGEDIDPRGGITRFRFLMYVTGGIFAWTFLPAFLFQAVSYFSWACWIAPNNLVVNELFGTISGLGMGIVTFDWAQISWIGSPLMIPWWAQIHIFAGFVFFYWFLLPILYYTNVWFLGYMPLGGQMPYDRFGEPYNISVIFDRQTRSFDLGKYNTYSALYLPGPYAMVYLLAFTLSSCLIVHTLLYHGKSLINGIKRIQIEEDDIHAKLMRRYPEVPNGWYYTLTAIFFVVSIVSVEVWPTGMPVWTLVLSLLLPALYFLPVGFVYAVTGQNVPINLLAEIIPGTLLAGKPLPNMVFKAFSIQTINSSLSFIQDLKFGHYMKVPPRASFMVQTVSCLMGCIVQVGVKQWLFARVPDICSPDQREFLTCPHNQVYFSASAIWGLIGPTRQFGNGTLYHGYLYALIVGAFLPVPFWLYQVWKPTTRLRYINIPVILNGPSLIPPARGINYSSWFVFGFIFQYFIRKRNFRWWSKFNYVLSAGLDSGTILASILIFLILQLPFANGGLQVNWWGNVGFANNLDGNPVANLVLQPGQFFDGPPGGHS